MNFQKFLTFPKVKQQVFQLKLYRNDFLSVYIELENPFANNPIQHEMKLNFRDQRCQTFIVSVILEQQKLLKYRYSIRVNNKNENEEKFRYFLNNNYQEENLIDEWNQVWYVYELKWNKQDFFGEFEGLNIPQNQQNQDFITYQLRELNPTDEHQLTKQFLTQVFENYQTFNPQQRDQILLYKNQQYYLNYIKVDISFGQLGKSLTKHIGTPLKAYMAQMNQIDEACKKKQDQIEQLKQEIQTKKCEWDKQLYQFQNFAQIKIQDSKYEVQTLQQMLEETNQKLINQTYEHMNIQKVDFNVKFDEQKQSQASIELEKALQNYSYTVELLQRNKQDLQKANLSNKNLQTENQQLHSLIQECKSKLKIAEEKLADYENDIQLNKDKNEQNKKTIAFLKKQIESQKIEIQNYITALNEMTIKLKEIEKQRTDFKRNLEAKTIQLKHLTDATTSQVLASEDISQLKSYIQELDLNRKQQTTNIKQLEQEAIKLKNDFEEMENNLYVQLSQQRFDIQQQLNEKDKAYTELKKKISQQQLVLPEKKGSINTVQFQQDLVKKEQEIEQLKNTILLEKKEQVKREQEIEQLKKTIQLEKVEQVNKEQEIEELKKTLINWQELFQKIQLENEQVTQYSKYLEGLVARAQTEGGKKLQEYEDERNKFNELRRQITEKYHNQQEKIQKDYDEQIKQLRDQKKQDISKLKEEIKIEQQQKESEIDSLKLQNKQRLEEEKQKFYKEKQKLLQEHQQKLNENQQTEHKLKASYEEMIQINSILQQTIIEKDEEIQKMQDQNNNFEQCRKLDQAKYNTLRMEQNKNKELEIQQIQKKYQNQIDELKSQSLEDIKNIDQKYQRQIQELNQKILNLEQQRSEERANFNQQRQSDVQKYKELQQQMLSQLQSYR